jgi:hypothetical protein
VFDPLAVLLLIASNQTYLRLKESEAEPEPAKRKAKNKKELAKSTAPSVELFMTDVDSEIFRKKDIVEIKPQKNNLEGGTF